MANTGDIPNNITLGASQAVRRNAADNGFEAFTPSGGPHAILSTTHTDTLVDSVVRGDLVVGNLTPKWARLPLGGSAKSFVTRDASDVVWSTGMLDLTTGKTLTVGNSLTLSGTDGKSLGLTGSLSIGADTSITGGGTIALAAFTLTVPATGTAALQDSTNNFSVIQNFINTTDASSTTTGSVVISGGIGIAKAGFFGGNVTITNTAPSLVLTDTTASAKSLTIAVDANAADFRESAGAAGSLLQLDLANALVKAGGTTDASSTTTGALQSAGGLGVAKKIYAGDRIVGAQDLQLTGSTGHFYMHEIISLANNGVAQLLHTTGNGQDTIGMIFIVSGSAAYAIYGVEGSINTTQEYLDPNSAYTPTSGNAGTFNIYWSAGNSQYEIENKTGNTRTLFVFEFVHA